MINLNGAYISFVIITQNEHLNYDGMVNNGW